MDFPSLTIKAINQGLKKKDFSAFEVVSFYLSQIKAKDKEINAFLQVDEKSALCQAKEIDEKIKAGQDIPLLAGVPCAIKDCILVDGFRATAGSKILENYQAPYTATSVKKLQDKGAIVLGKTNMDEFAMGSSTEMSAFKITKNPRDLSRVPGGSSGGSAAAVSGQEAVFALGSDTGGSIRQPASFCGIVGLKPTYGAVSRYGLIAYASSLDQIGPLAKNIEDCETIFEIIKGEDKNDSTSSSNNIIDSFCHPNKQEINLSQIKIGVPKEYFAQGQEKEVESSIRQVLGKLEKNNVKIKEISLPHSKYALPCYYLIATSEASANLARFDGVRYGKSEQGGNLLDSYLKTRGKGFGEEVKRRIMLGTFALSSGYYDDFYLKAQKVRTLIKKDFSQAFEKVDFILTPTSPFPAFKIGQKIDNPLQMYLSDIYTVPVNLAGIPAISMPCPQSCLEKGGSQLPIGLQIMAPYFREKSIFQIAKIIEKL